MGQPALLRRLAERFAFWLAWHLPRWLVYYAGIRLWAHASARGDDNAGDTPMCEVLGRWRER